jgi:hypothetical protein
VKRHSDAASTGCSFTIEEFKKDDPRLMEFLEIPDEAQQASFHATIQLMPGSDVLQMENWGSWNAFNLTDKDFRHLQSLGLKGKLRVTGWGTSGHAPFKARTLIVARHQIRDSVDLPEPNNCEIVYLQVGDKWQKLPSDAPVLRRRFRLSIDPANDKLTNMWAELYFGSTMGGGGGGGAFNWESAG